MGAATRHPDASESSGKTRTRLADRDNSGGQVCFYVEPYHVVHTGARHPDCVIGNGHPIRRPGYFNCCEGMNICHGATHPGRSYTGFWRIRSCVLGERRCGDHKARLHGKERVPAERNGFRLEAMVIFDDRNSKHADRYHKRRGLRVIITIEVRKEKAFVS